MTRALLFTRTTGYRHDSIEAGVGAVRALAAEDGVEVDHTEDPQAFAEESLRGYAVVVWLSTTGDVLDAAQRGALADWLGSGGSFAGVHSATASEPGWPEFERLAGAVFTGHPEVQVGTVQVEDPTHPSTRELPAVWEHEDEWYEFRTNPRGRVHVLLRVDEATYDGGGMGADHPVAWCHRYGDGHCWYTSLGHRVEAYADPVFLAHLQGGLRSLWSPVVGPRRQPWTAPRTDSSSST